MCVIGQYDSTAMKSIVNKINKLPFERIDNDLSYE